MVKILVEASTMCIHKYTQNMRNVGEVFPPLFLCWEKINAAPRKKERNRSFYVTFHTKSSHSNATAAASPSNYHFSLYFALFSQHSLPSSMACFYHSSKHLILTFFWGFILQLCCVADVILFYFFRVVQYVVCD